jgi:predicted CXXCH cytochrome family protein
VALQTFAVFVWTLLAVTGLAASRPEITAHQQLGGAAMCETCHRFPATRTHVTGVRPTFEVPPTLPLGPGGELTCVTCHDLTAASAPNRATLREGLNDANLCTSCHTTDSDDGSRLAHALRVGTAHGQSGPTGSRTAAASLECMACHDGIIGRDGHWPGQSERAASGTDRGHPVRVNYALAQSSSLNLKPVALLDVALRFENGDVGCRSCHDAFSRLASSLVIDNRGSALCLACHRI